MSNIDKYIKEISEYQDILRLQIQREFIEDLGVALSEKECVYNDINYYLDNKFDEWQEHDFIQYIKYLEKLTEITNNLGL